VLSGYAAGISSFLRKESPPRRAVKTAVRSLRRFWAGRRVIPPPGRIYDAPCGGITILVAHYVALGDIIPPPESRRFFRRLAAKAASGVFAASGGGGGSAWPVATSVATCRSATRRHMAAKETGGGETRATALRRPSMPPTDHLTFG